MGGDEGIFISKHSIVAKVRRDNACHLSGKIMGALLLCNLSESVGGFDGWVDGRGPACHM